MTQPEGNPDHGPGKRRIEPRLMALLLLAFLFAAWLLSLLMGFVWRAV